MNDTPAILDLDQLRDVTMDDPELMREIVNALIDDTTKHMALLDAAIREQDSEKCMRLAHYSKGACANVGATSAAAICKEIEVRARRGEFVECGESLQALGRQVELLKAESKKL